MKVRRSGSSRRSAGSSSHEIAAAFGEAIKKHVHGARAGGEFGCDQGAERPIVAGAQRLWSGRQARDDRGGGRGVAEPRQQRRRQERHVPGDADHRLQTGVAARPVPRRDRRAAPGPRSLPIGDDVDSQTGERDRVVRHDHDLVEQRTEDLELPIDDASSLHEQQRLDGTAQAPATSPGQNRRRRHGDHGH